MKKYLKRFLLWVGVLQLRPQQEVIEILKRSIKVEEQEACDHRTLMSIKRGDMWYRCTSCNQIWFLPFSLLWNADRTPDLIETLKKITKYKVKKKSQTLKECEEERVKK